MKMKHDTLVGKLNESIWANTSRGVSMGEIALSLELLKRAKAQNPSLFDKLAPEISKLLPS